MSEYRPLFGGAARGDRASVDRGVRVHASRALAVSLVTGAALALTPTALTTPTAPTGPASAATRAASAASAVSAVPAAATVSTVPAGPVASAPLAVHGREDAPPAFQIRDPRIVESSGLAASWTHRDVYWTHNDSGSAPRVYAVDGRSGKTVATVTLAGVEARDWEAIALGPNGQLYVADIGDNRNGTWPEVWIYRFPEPKTLGDTTVTPTRYTVRYADGPRDAEALMVHPKTGRVYIASKSDEGKGGLYQGPAELVPSDRGVNTFRRSTDLRLWVTDGAFSRDGGRLALRGYFAGTLYHWRDGELTRPSRLSVPLQQQGESVTFTSDGRTLMLGSEGENSTVQPVRLSDDQLPDQGGREEERATSGGGDERRGGGERGGEAASDEEKEQNLSRLGISFVAATVLLLGLRRLFRRRG